MSAKEQNLDKLKTELASIRKSGSLKQFSRIVEILAENQHNAIAKDASVLLADIKKPEVVDLMIAEIKNHKNREIKRQLVQACWESGLDYSIHLTDFANIFIEADYETAIEAFTLIENTVLDFAPNMEIKAEMTDKIKAIVLDLPEHKQNLAMELIHILRS